MIYSIATKFIEIGCYIVAGISVLMTLGMALAVIIILLKTKDPDDNEGTKS
jgi:hypothetical protein